jgi:anti-sigma regulatory factor (Ser/Thr protein kinase)
VASALDGCPAAVDAALCVSEAVANAVTHTRSGQPGGIVQVRVTVAEGAWVRLIVDDQGAPVSPTLEPSGLGDEHGRGLQVIAALAGAWQADGGPGGRSVRMELPWQLTSSQAGGGGW